MARWLLACAVVAGWLFACMHYPYVVIASLVCATVIAIRLLR